MNDNFDWFKWWLAFCVLITVFGIIFGVWVVLEILDIGREAVNA